MTSPRERLDSSTPTALDALVGHAPPVAGSRTPAAGADRWVLSQLQRPLLDVGLRLVLWDGTSAFPASGAPAATIAVRDRATLWNLIWKPELTFGEAYSTRRLEVYGDLVSCLERLYRARPPRPVRGLSRLLLLRPSTPRRSRHDIHHHYDLGNDFYATWLDSEMVYTCAYFPEPEATLEEAQLAKMEHVCRKLRLQPGEQVVEAGCGWGSLALYMARHYGVRVRAYNLSREQIRYARDRAARDGLTGAVQFVEDDYRAITGQFDVFVSVGMLEHVGLAQFRQFGALLNRTLPSSSGRGLLHFIGRDFTFPLNRWIRKRIFPGGYPPTLTQVTRRILEPGGFSVLDVENLRPHYAKTLMHWRTRFERRTAQAGLDDAFTRAWRLYLAGSEAAFTTGSMQLFQVAFTRSRCDDIPWIRVA